MMEKSDANVSPRDRPSPDSSSPSTPAECSDEASGGLGPVVTSEKTPEPQESQAMSSSHDQPPPSPITWGHYGVVIGAFCGLFASFGWRSGSGFFQGYYQEDQLRDYSPSTIAWINSVGFFLMYFGACFVGPITHRMGPQPLLLIGSLMHVAGLLGASFCSKFYQFFLTQGIISSLGASAVFFISVQTVGRWFETQQAFAIGIGASGVSAGGVIFPLMIKHLIPQIGFGWTMRCATLLILVLVAASNLTLRRQPMHMRQRRRQQMAVPDGEGTWADFWTWKLVLTVAGTTLFANGYFVILTFLSTVAGMRGWTDQVNSLVVLNGASFFGRIIPGLVADRVGSYNTMFVLGVVSTILVLAVWLPDTGLPGSIVFSIIFGFTSASTVSLGPAMLFQMSELRHITRNLAVFYLVQSFAGLTSSPIGGALLAAGHERGPLYLQVFCGLMTGLGTALILLARLNLSGGVVWKKV